MIGIRLVGRVFMDEVSWVAGDPTMQQTLLWRGQYIYKYYETNAACNTRLVYAIYICRWLSCVAENGMELLLTNLLWCTVLQQLVSHALIECLQLISYSLGLYFFTFITVILTFKTMRSDSMLCLTIYCTHDKPDWKFPIGHTPMWTIFVCEILVGVRWKVDENGKRILNSSSNKPVLQFVAIQRSDSGEWALPGVSYCM